MRALIGLGALFLLGLLSLGIGVLRGITRSRIRAICLLVCAVASHLITLVAKSRFAASYQELADVLKSSVTDLAQSDFWKMIDGSESFRNVLMQTAGALAAPLIYLLVFLILQLLTWIIYLIVMIFIGRRLKEKDSNRRLRFLRILGLTVVQVLIVAFVFLTPISFYLQIVGTAVNTVEKSGIGEAEQLQFVEKMTIVSEKESGLIRVYRALGGNAVSKSLTKMKIGEGKTNLVDEINVMAELSGEILSLKNAGDIGNYGENEARTIEQIGETFGKSELLSTIAGELLFQVTDKWSNDQPFANMERPQINEILEPSIDVLIEDFHRDSRSVSAVKADFKTLARIVSALAQSGITESLEDQEELINKLGSSNVIRTVILILGENPTLQNLIQEVTNLGMRAIGNMLSLPKNAAEVYENFIRRLTASINDILPQNITFEEKVELLTDSLMNILADSGVNLNLDRELFKLYADAILAEFDGRTSVTDTDVREFFLVYATVQAENQRRSAEEDIAYVVSLAETELTFRSSLYAGKTLQELRNSTAAGMLANIASEIVHEGNQEADEAVFAEKVLGIIEKYTDAFAKATGKKNLAKTLKNGMQNVQIRIDSVSEEDLKITASICAESFPTSIVTVEVLLIDPNAAGNGMTAESLRSEADSINSLFHTAALLKDKLPGGNSLDSLTDISEEIGTILNTLGQTTSFGEERTAHLTQAVFQSEQVRRNLNLDLKTATELAYEATRPVDGETVNYKATLISVSRGTEIARMIGESDGKVDEEEIREMLRDMTPQTANMMCVYITPERMHGYGIPDEKCESSARFLHALFTEMGQKELYSDRYDEQTKAVAGMFDIAMAASQNAEEERLFNHGSETGRLNMTAAEMVEILMHSDMVCNAAIHSMMENGAVRAEMINPFGIRISESSEDAQDYMAALLNYYDLHRNEQKTLLIKLRAIAPIFGISEISFN